MKQEIIKVLQSAINEKQREGYTFKAIAIESGVDKGCISRIAHGGNFPDRDNVLKLAVYFGFPPSRVFSVEDKTKVTIYPNEPMPRIVETLLRNDPNIMAEDAVKIHAIFCTAYKHYTKFGVRV